MTSPDPRSQRPDGLLQDRQFVRYLVARGLSGAGSVATLIALPVLVYRLSGDPGLTALVAGCEAAPYLLFGLFSGALTDRWNDRGHPPPDARRVPPARAPHRGPAVPRHP
jgi:MFS family permease